MAVFVLRHCVFCFCSSPDLPPVIASASPSRYSPRRAEIPACFLWKSPLSLLSFSMPPWSPSCSLDRTRDTLKKAFAKTTKKNPVQERHTNIKSNMQTWFEMTTTVCMYWYTCLLMMNYLSYHVQRTWVQSSTAVSQLYKKTWPAVQAVVDSGKIVQEIGHSHCNDSAKTEKYNWHYITHTYVEHEVEFYKRD